MYVRSRFLFVFKSLFGFLFISISVPCVFYLYFQVVNDTGDISLLLPNLNWILLLLMVGRSLGTFW